MDPKRDRWIGRLESMAPEAFGYGWRDGAIGMAWESYVLLCLRDSLKPNPYPEDIRLTATVWNDALEAPDRKELALVLPTPAEVVPLAHHQYLLLGAWAAREALAFVDDKQREALEWVVRRLEFAAVTQRMGRRTAGRLFFGTASLLTAHSIKEQLEQIRIDKAKPEEQLFVEYLEAWAEMDHRGETAIYDQSSDPQVHALNAIHHLMSAFLFGANDVCSTAVRHLASAHRYAYGPHRWRAFWERFWEERSQIAQVPSLYCKAGVWHYARKVLTRL